MRVTGLDGRVLQTSMIDKRGGDRYSRHSRDVLGCHFHPGIHNPQIIHIMSSWEDLQALGLLAMRNGPCMLTETATHTNIIYVAGIVVQYFEMRLGDSSAEALRWHSWISAAMGTSVLVHTFRNGS